MEERIGELFRTYSAMVFRVCMRYSGSREESEDLTQEVFLKVDKGLASFSGKSALSTWIYRIAINVCIDSMRARKRRGEVGLEQLDSLVVGNLGANADTVLARIDLDRILSQVKPEIREFLLLTQGEGMTFEQAAAVTGKSADAIAKAVSRFRKAISAKRRILTALGFGQGLKEGGV